MVEQSFRIVLMLIRNEEFLYIFVSSNAKCRIFYISTFYVATELIPYFGLDAAVVSEIWHLLAHWLDLVSNNQYVKNN